MMPVIVQSLIRSAKNRLLHLPLPHSPTRKGKDLTGLILMLAVFGIVLVVVIMRAVPSR